MCNFLVDDMWDGFWPVCLKQEAPFCAKGAAEDLQWKGKQYREH